MKEYEVRAISVGKPVLLDTDKGPLKTAIKKRRVDEPVWLSRLNFEGDYQADQKNHGGPDKAVCLYPAQHYKHWKDHYQQTFTFPSFGENLTVEGVDEREAAIGDRYLLGDAELEVSEPRKPCYIIARKYGLDDFPTKMIEKGFSGFYLRVVKEGSVKPEDKLILKERDSLHITVADVNDVLFHDRENKDKISRILETPALAAGLRASLERKL
ncbi:MOSC domain-containing protein [Thalassobacillus devorans]|uniref:MOSC domain-containing protein n=1 Tax=Thalassobacillus devorans TaxID=279813 RepID=UPI000A1C976D|nr:MOSC domain-containing protein [Thalassobacillus devorans]